MFNEVYELYKVYEVHGGSHSRCEIPKILQDLCYMFRFEAFGVCAQGVWPLNTLSGYAPRFLCNVFRVRVQGIRSLNSLRSVSQGLNLIHVGQSSVYDISKILKVCVVS